MSSTSWERQPTLRWVWRKQVLDSFDGHRPMVTLVKVLQQAVETSEGPKWVDVPEFDEDQSA